MSDEPNTNSDENPLYDDNPAAVNSVPPQLKHLSDLEHVRARPASTLAIPKSKVCITWSYEAVDNAIDEVMAKYAKEVPITINLDGSVTCRR